VRVIQTTEELQRQANEWRAAGLTIGLVPTMGFFHDGHLALMREARKQCDRVITTLFVNPMQFGPNEDLDAYPRNLDRDREMAEGEGVDLLFCPSQTEMYGENFQTKVSLAKISQGLCGADRPGHFDGVATIVAKLFNLARPHIAVFGQKDFQQLALIRQLVADLNFDIEIIGHPIVREDDGLAMSSRNKYLDSDERQIAVCLYQAIVEAKRMVAEAGGSRSAHEIITMAENMIERHPECSVEYVRVVDKATLRPIDLAGADSVLVLAMKVNNKVRLIDNSPLC